MSENWVPTVTTGVNGRHLQEGEQGHLQSREWATIKAVRVLSEGVTS